MSKIIENAQMEIPRADGRCTDTSDDTGVRTASFSLRDLSLEQYMQFTGLTPQKMMEEFRATGI